MTGVELQEVQEKEREEERVVAQTLQEVITDVENSVQIEELLGTLIDQTEEVAQSEFNQLLDNVLVEFDAVEG